MTGIIRPRSKEIADREWLMVREKNEVQKEFWVLNSNRDVIYQTKTRLGAEAFILGRGSGTMVKVTGVVLPDPFRR